MATPYASASSGAADNGQTLIERVGSAGLLPPPSPTTRDER